MGAKKLSLRQWGRLEIIYTTVADNMDDLKYERANNVEVKHWHLVKIDESRRLLTEASRILGGTQ